MLQSGCYSPKPAIPASLPYISSFGQVILELCGTKHIVVAPLGFYHVVDDGTFVYVVIDCLIEDDPAK